MDTYLSTEISIDSLDTGDGDGRPRYGMSSVESQAELMIEDQLKLCGSLHILAVIGVIISSFLHAIEFAP